jgi:ABC-2 type transport system permease protein
MKKLLSFIKKEFYHILRDPLTLLIMFVMPVMLMSILSYAVSTDIKNIPFVVFDQSKSTDSKRLIEKIDANAYFQLKANCHTAEEVENAFQKGLCAMAIIIPSDFGNEPLHSGASTIQVMVDASDPNQASTMANYFQAEVIAFQQTKNKSAAVNSSIQIVVKMLYNPQMLSTFNIVPGLKGMVLLLICTLMTSIAIVREKELGTMEILLVSPLKPQVIIFAKAIPYLIISLVDVVLILFYPIIF